MRGYREIILAAGLGSLLTLAACSPAPVVDTRDYQAPSTQPVASPLTWAQADARSIGAELHKAGKAVGEQATGLRSEANTAPAPVADKMRERADTLVGIAADVNAQAKAVDPGLTRQIEQVQAELKALDERTKATIAGANATIATVTAEREGWKKKYEDAKSMARWVPFLVLGVVAGFVLIAIKAHPALSWLPGEIGGGVMGGCLIALLYIHTRDTYPLATAIAAGVLVLALIAPTVYRLNTMQRAQ